MNFKTVKTMKKYIKPEVNIVAVKFQPLLGNSVTTVTGDASDIDIANEDFGGGAADSRRRNSQWDDEEDEW